MNTIYVPAHGKQPAFKWDSGSENRIRQMFPSAAHNPRILASGQQVLAVRRFKQGGNVYCGLANDREKSSFYGIDPKQIGLKGLGYSRPFTLERTPQTTKVVRGYFASTLSEVGCFTLIQLGPPQDNKRWLDLDPLAKALNRIPVLRALYPQNADGFSARAWVEEFTQANMQFRWARLPLPLPTPAALELHLSFYANALTFSQKSLTPCEAKPTHLVVAPGVVRGGGQIMLKFGLGTTNNNSVWDGPARQLETWGEHIYRGFQSLCVKSSRKARTG